MKERLLFILFLCLCSLSHAQEFELKQTKAWVPYEKRFLIDVRLGANFDLFHRSDHSDSRILSSKKSTTPTYDISMSYLFSKRLGWYGNLHMNFYKERFPDEVHSIIDDLINEFFKEFFGSINRLHPSINAGMLYRIEKGRWGIYPRAGVGYMAYLSDRKSTKNKKKNGQEISMSYRQKARPLFAEMGVSVNYYASKSTFFTVQAGYQQPLQKSSAQLIYTADGVETENIHYRSRSIGRNIKLSTGVGLYF